MGVTDLQSVREVKLEHALLIANRRVIQLEAQLARVTEEYYKTWEVLRTYNPQDIKLEYIEFNSVNKEEGK